MSKPLVFSDESLNSYGFYLKNDGCDLSLFKKNPILLWMHNRSWRGSKDEILPIGTVKDIKFNEEKQQWEAEPVFDLEDEFAAEIGRKYDAGVLRMCSAGLRPLEFSEDPKLMKKGQTRATVTKWILREISIVDIGSNYNAVALYNDDDEVINLADDDQHIPVPKIKLSDKPKIQKQMEVIKLADGRELTVSQVQELAEKASTQEQTITTLTADRDQLKTEVDGYKQAEKDRLSAEATNLVDAAIKDGRIDATPKEDGKSAKENWLKFFENDHESAKSALESIPSRKTAFTKLQDGETEKLDEREELAKLSWEELDRSDKLAACRANHYDLYEEKFEKKFGRKPNKQV